VPVRGSDVYWTLVIRVPHVSSWTAAVVSQLAW